VADHTGARAVEDTQLEAMEVVAILFYMLAKQQQKHSMFLRLIWLNKAYPVYHMKGTKAYESHQDSKAYI